MRTSLVAAVFLLASHGACADYLQPRQGFVSSLLSVFGPHDDDDDPTSKTTPSKPSKTPLPTPTTTKKVTTTITSKARSSANPTPEPTSTDTDAETASKTSTDESTITSSPTLTTSTTTPNPTSTSLPINPLPPPAPVKSNGGISPAGIAVAVIFGIVILLVIAWLVFRYHPKCRAWWDARQQEKYKQRSYRDGLSGAGGGLTRGRVGLQSFFQPKAARTQDAPPMPGIKRKTIHWGAPSPKVGSPDLENGSSQTRAVNQSAFPHGMERAYSKNGGALHDGYPMGEKVPLAELASPMGVDRGRGHSQQPTQRYEVSPLLKSATPTSPSMSPVSPMGGHRKSFGARSAVTIKSYTSERKGGTPPARLNRESKALPEVKVNGQVVYELA